MSLVSGTAYGQCAVCGNPAFASGDNDIARAFGNGSPPSVRIRTGLVYSYLQMSDLYGGAVQLPISEKSQWVQTRDWALRLHVVTAMVGVELGSGTAMQLILPMARADSTRATGDSKVFDADGVPVADFSDYGLSDMELRVRQRVNGLLGLSGRWMPQVVVSVGMVAPTGNFIVKDPAGAITDQYVSLGRGTWWALGNLDFFGKIADNMGYSLTNSVRYALHSNVNQGYLFRWGTELSSTLSANFVIIPGLLNAALAGEFQWRDAGLERILPEDPIEPFPNGGGIWLGVNPTLQAIIGAGVSATVTVRVPLYRDVNGYQPVPGLGGIFALNWSWDAPSSALALATAKSAKPTPALLPGDRTKEPAVAQVLVPGKITLVEYGADWCAVCKRLRPKLVTFANGRDDVVFRHINVTDWRVERMRRVLPAQPGLPVLDIFGPDGRLIKRLWGEQTFGFAQSLPVAAK